VQEPAIGEPWTVEDLTRAAGTKQRTYIRRLCRLGKFKGARKFGNTWMIPYEEGKRWLEQRDSSPECSPEA